MSGKHDYAHSIIRRGLLDGLVSFSELEKRISALPTEGERGDAFEAFAEAYLATQKIVQVEQVWPDRHIPLEILKAFKIPFKDLGADGVFRSLSGDLNAYQVKFRTGRVPLRWEELATFMGLTDLARQRVVFTNTDRLPDILGDRRGFYPIRGTDLDRLTASDFKTIRDWLVSGRIKPELKQPDPHQDEAIAAISEGLSGNDRVTAVMACGTGKTLMALWLAEKMRSKRIVVLVPSLALLRQTLHEWLKETRWEKPRFLSVCSDLTIKRGLDELVVRQADLDFPLNPDASEVRSFLSGSDDGVRVVFTTYQSSRIVGEALDGTSGFDLGIFDEAHKAAGRQGTNFTFGLKDENLPIAKRVFMNGDTAPVQYPTQG